MTVVLNIINYTRIEYLWFAFNTVQEGVWLKLIVLILLYITA